MRLRILFYSSFPEMSKYGRNFTEDMVEYALRRDPAKPGGDLKAKKQKTAGIREL